jgi:iron complex transport system permease protein
MSSSLAAEAPARRTPRPVGETAAWIALAAAVCALMIGSLGVGRYEVGWLQTLAILLQRFVDLGVPFTPAQEVVVLTVRLPRVLVAAFAGAGLAIAGAALQGVFRNPLVGPQIIGVSAGAGFGGALAILVGAGSLAIVGGAFVFALAALVLVVLLARIDGRAPILMLVLAGLVVSALFGALTSLLVFVADPETKLPGIVFWLLGSFAAANYIQAAIVAVATTLGAATLLALAWRVNVLSLGDEDAASLGIRVEPLRWTILGACCLIVAGQVAVSGVVGWVGLVVPHIARMIVGADHRRLLPAAMLVGAGYMVAVDGIARTATAAEIPLGILTALVGAPIFAVLLRKLQRRGWADA